MERILPNSLAERVWEWKDWPAPYCMSWVELGLTQAGLPCATILVQEISQIPYFYSFALLPRKQRWGGDTNTMDEFLYEFALLTVSEIQF